MGMRPVLIHLASGQWEAVQLDAERLGIPAAQLVRNAVDHIFVSGRIIPCNYVASGGVVLASGAITLAPSIFSGR